MAQQTCVDRVQSATLQFGWCHRMPRLGVIVLALISMRYIDPGYEHIWEGRAKTKIRIPKKILAYPVQSVELQLAWVLLGQDASPDSWVQVQIRVQVAHCHRALLVLQTVAAAVVLVQAAVLGLLVHRNTDVAVAAADSLTWCWGGGVAIRKRIVRRRTC